MRGGRGHESLDQRAEVEQHLEFGPRRQQRPPYRVLGSGPIEGQHIGTAGAPAEDLDQPKALQPLQRLADRRPAGAKHLRQLALDGQSLTLDELAEGDRRDQSIGDLLRRVAPVERADPSTELGQCRLLARRSIVHRSEGSK